MTRGDADGTYRTIHRKLQRTRGPASNYTCSCGEPAVQWAYQFTGEELRAPDGRFPHSLDPDDYEPMCRKCHQAFDLEHDPAMAEAILEGRRRGGAVSAPLMGRAVAGRRRRCLECGLISNPGSVGVHQNSTGHNGYEEIGAER